MSDLLPGVYKAIRKNNTVYYRASITHKNKHISLGSFDTEADAHSAYKEATDVIGDPECNVDSYSNVKRVLGFDKWVVLCNFRDNGVYIPNPIYVRPRLFYYYFSPDDFFIFSSEDLFYYSAHKIQRRGGHFFVADYGSQINILSRYGIKSHAVAGKDYVFLNGNHQDMQYSNVKVINAYYGVSMESPGNYRAKIHINGYMNIGIYEDAITAAIAYNKAIDILNERGNTRQYNSNYIDGLSPKSYADIYASVHVSKKLYSLIWQNNL